MTDEQLIEKYGTAPQFIDGQYELCFINDEMNLELLMDLNRAGYVYESLLEEVEFENVYGCTAYIGYMDIYYFTKIERQ
jgi:hypothetical protein